MNTKKILNISRPRFWIYEIGPYIVGVAAAASSNYSIWLVPAIIIFFIFFTYPANIYIYGVNDIYDYETDKLNPKKISYESLVYPEEHKPLLKHIFFVNTPFLIYGLFTLSFQALIALCLFFFFAGFYSAKPIRAKARPILDSIFSAGHYVATGVFSYILVAQILDIKISWLVVFICAIASIAWAISMHAYSAVPDIKADKDANLETIATKLGKKKTIYLCAFLYILSAILVYQYIGVISLLLGLVYVHLMYKSLNTNDDELFKIYTYFPIINSLSGMIIFFTVLLFN
jgi:4-hydroxybenzoate polyprenyltransferase